MSLEFHYNESMDNIRRDIGYAIDDEIEAIEFYSILFNYMMDRAKWCMDVGLSEQANGMVALARKISIIGTEEMEHRNILKQIQLTIDEV